MTLTVSVLSLASILYVHRVAFAESQGTIDGMKAAVRCQICLSASISHVLVPCGECGTVWRGVVQCDVKVLWWCVVMRC